MEQQPGHLERLARNRWTMLMLLGAVLIGWSALKPWCPRIAASSTVSYPLWWGLTLVYALDVRGRLATVYAGLLASWAFFFAHDIPYLMGVPVWSGTLLAMMVATGFLGGLANGRRCAGIAAIAGAGLCALWSLHRLASGADAMTLAWSARRELVVCLPLIVLGGLLAEALVAWRTPPALRRPAPRVLWALVLGLTLPELSAQLLRWCLALHG